MLEVLTNEAIELSSALEIHIKAVFRSTVTTAKMTLSEFSVCAIYIFLGW